MTTQRTEGERRSAPRRSADRVMMQPEEQDYDPDYVPNFLTAQELQARDPAKPDLRRGNDRRKDPFAEG